MDANAITEALRDLLGPVVSHYAGTPPAASTWNWQGWYIEADGGIDTDGTCFIDPDTLDKLHAASQIVRRMVTP